MKAPRTPLPTNRGGHTLSWGKRNYPHATTCDQAYVDRTRAPRRNTLSARGSILLSRMVAASYDNVACAIVFGLDVAVFAALAAAAAVIAVGAGQTYESSLSLKTREKIDEGMNDMWDWGADRVDDATD